MQPTFRELVLTRLPVKVEKRLGRYASSMLSLETQAEVCAEDLVIQLSTELLASQRIKHEDTYTIGVPRTWWDHLKVSLPTWVAKRLRAPEYNEVVLRTKFREYMTYPKANVVPPPREIGPIFTIQMGDSHISDTRWPVTKGKGAEIIDPYLGYADVYRLLSDELAKDCPYDQYTYTVDRFLKALGELGVNVSEMIRR